MARGTALGSTTQICPRSSLISPVFQGHLRNSSLGHCLGSSHDWLEKWLLTLRGFYAQTVLPVPTASASMNESNSLSFIGIMELKLMIVSLRIPNSKSVVLPKKLLHRRDKMRRVNTIQFQAHDSDSTSSFPTSRRDVY
jgi:hypothetical protein